MSKHKRILASLESAIRTLQNPTSNPAQNYLTQEALAGGEFLKKGDFSQLPKGMFFDFKMPGEEMKAYRNLQNVGAEGTYALGDGAGSGKRMGLAQQFLGDKFARDASANYQDNIRNAAGNIRNALAGAAGAKSQTDLSVISALSNLYGSMPKGNGILGSILGMAGMLGSSAFDAAAKAGKF